MNIDYIRDHGHSVHFRRRIPEGCERRFVTFLGKKGYSENLLDSKIVREDELRVNPHGFDLRLMSSVDGVSAMPSEGKDLVIVADVQDVLYFRIFDADGEGVVNTDENQLPGKAPQIAELKSLLSGLWGVKQLSQDDKDRVISVVTSIVVHTHLHYGLPGGPARILYLSNLQPEDSAIGFILANGEKIGEWIHWLAFIRFGTMQEDVGEPALRLFEVSLSRPWTRDGILMSTSPIYSIFKNYDSHNNKTIIDTDRLQSFPNPSKYRSTLIVVPATNDWAMVHQVRQYGHRPIEF